jgi:hypothetical protein
MTKFWILHGESSRGFADSLTSTLRSQGWDVDTGGLRFPLNSLMVSVLDGWIAVVDFDIANDPSFLKTMKQSIEHSDSLGVFCAIIKAEGGQVEQIEPGRVLAGDIEDVSGTVRRLVAAYDDFAASLREVIKFRRERRDLVVSAGEEYVEATLKGLGRRGWYFLVFGVVWHVIAALALAVGVDVGYTRIAGLPTGQLTEGAVFGLVATFVGVVGLLLALVRYSINLGRFFMQEAIVTLNRQHAIRYGRFFLLAFGENISRQEVAEVLRDWNIVSVTSTIPAAQHEADNILRSLGEGARLLLKMNEDKIVGKAK